jgi:hypothetical protein
MNDQEFLKLVNKTTRRNLIIGIFITALGGFMLWLGLSGVDSEMASMSKGGIIAFYVFTGIFLAVGLLMISIAVRAKSKIKNGSHPLVNAIEKSGSDYVIWFYEYVVEASAGPAKNTGHSIWIRCADKKQYTINVKKGMVQDALSYLSNKFPNALVGYSKDLEKAYKERLAKS